MRITLGFFLIISGLTMAPAYAQKCTVDHTGKDFTFTISDSCLSSNISRSGADAKLAFAQMQTLAGDLYQQQAYEKAYTLYRVLAEYGDKFSQHRLAVMYQNARGAQQDLVQAYAWSHVAAEASQQDFIHYHRLISRRLNDRQMTEADHLARQYLADYGIYSNLNKAKKVVRKHRSACPGLHSDAVCDHAQTVDLNCKVAKNTKPGHECLALGAVGLSGINGLPAADLQTLELAMSEMMDRFQPGGS